MPDNNELHIAAKKGDLEHVQTLVHNFDINAKGGEEERFVIDLYLSLFDLPHSAFVFFSIHYD